MRTAYLISVFFGLFLVSCMKQPTTPTRTNSQRPTNASVIAPSNEAELVLHTIQGKFLDLDSTTLRVYLFVDATKAGKRLSVEEFARSYILNYVIYTDYGNRDRLGYANIPLSPQNVTATGEHLVVTFEVRKSNKADSGVLLSEISQAGTTKKVLNDLPLRFRQQRVSDQLGVFSDDHPGLPTLRHYVQAHEPVRIAPLDNSTKPLYVSYYKHSFEAAASPMNTNPRTSTRPLLPDSTFRLTTGGALRFVQEGLYYFVLDSTQVEGMSLLVTDERFPRFTRPEQLVQPLLYLSTKQEINDIQSAREEKKALDRYWLTLLNGNPELARQVIKTYYQRTTEANRLFTTYKEGWKTDKGMIYMVLGAPDRIQRSKDREVWVYDQRANANNINFTFNKRSNQFVDDHYELVRYVEYQPIWYPIVEAWRNGAIR